MSLEANLEFVNIAPPSDFGERSVSDRYDPEAIPTLITNASIWTGNHGGKEVILKGEIFLDKGIVKYVGDRTPASLVASNRLVAHSVVDDQPDINRIFLST